ENVRILSGRALVVEQFQRLNGKVLHEAFVVERNFLIKAFRVQIRVSGDRSTLPKIRKLSSGKRQPGMGHGIVGYVASIQPDGFAIEGIGQCFIGRGWVSERAGRQCNTSDEIFIELTIET